MGHFSLEHPLLWSEGGSPPETPDSKYAWSTVGIGGAFHAFDDSFGRVAKSETTNANLSPGSVRQSPRSRLA